jgi:Protein of unknown function (DUF3105)
VTSGRDRATQRRAALVGVGILAVVALVLGTAGFLRAVDSTAEPLSSFGVPAAQAGCTAVIEDPTTGTGEHIGPGTAEPDRTRVDYPTNPPSSGAHLATPTFPNLPYYTTRDVPAVERLVHNLEHGYTIAWYDPALPESDLDQLSELAAQIRADTEPKFIAAPWDTTRGGLPDDAAIALSHWGREVGYRQYCQALSGEAIEAFVVAHPASDSPEPDAP